MPGPPLEELSQYERLGDNSYYVKLGRVLQFPERHSWVVGIVKTHLTSNPVVLGNTSTKFAVTIEDSGVIFHCTTQHFILRKHATLLGIRDQADSTYTSLGEGLEEDDTEDSADDCAPPIETFISNGIDRAFRHQGAIAPMMGPSSIKADLQTECNGLEAECATYLKCVLQAVMLTYGGTGLGKDLRDFTNEYLKQKKMTPADVTHLDNLGVFKAFSLAVNPKASTPTSTVKKPKIGSLMAMISSLAPLSPSFYDCIATLITYRCEVAHRLKRDEGLDSGVAGCMAGATEELTTYIHKNQLIARLLPASKSARTHSEVRIVTDGDGAFGRVQALVKTISHITAESAFGLSLSAQFYAEAATKRIAGKPSGLFQNLYPHFTTERLKLTACPVSSPIAAGTSSATSTTASTPSAAAPSTLAQVLQSLPGSAETSGLVFAELHALRAQLKRQRLGQIAASQELRVTVTGPEVSTPTAERKVMFAQLMYEVFGVAPAKVNFNVLIRAGGGDVIVYTTNLSLTKKQKHFIEEEAMRAIRAGNENTEGSCKKREPSHEEEDDQAIKRQRRDEEQL